MMTRKSLKRKDPFIRIELKIEFNVPSSARAKRRHAIPAGLAKKMQGFGWRSKNDTSGWAAEKKEKAARKSGETRASDLVRRGGLPR